jgi:DNA adenine methylase
VLLAQDPEGISEVVNDLYSNLTWFWRVLQEPEFFYEFKKRVEATPCSQKEFDDSARRLRGFMHDQSWWERAVDFFVVNRQSHQALGKDFATLARTRTRRGMNELPSAWLNAIEGLPDVHARLQRVVILNDDAVKVIRQQDDRRTLFYCDPPYIHTTRTVTDAYAHEMKDAQHSDLLEVLAGIKGRFLLSGYRSELYDYAAKKLKWRRVDYSIDNKASGKKTKDKEIECVWMNY